MSNEYLAMRRVDSISPVVLVSLVALAGCTTPNPASCVDNHCGDPALPFCDVDGSIGGTANTCIAVECTAGEFEACRGDRALMCSASGDNYDTVECEYGCSDASGGCNTCNTTDCEKHIIPKYLPTICDQLSPLPALTISSDTTVDTTDDASCTSIVTQAGAPDICVMHYGTVTIERNRTYTAIGNRVLALIADRAFTVDGILDVSATQQRSGPGGGFTTSGTANDNPGGGAGYRTAGGSGASGTVDGGAANGGAAGVNPTLLTELVGGTKPSPGIKVEAVGGAGGGITLVSCRGTLSVPGLVDAGGGGGAGAHFYPTGPAHYSSPAGGGSGGTVVLQGLQVRVTGEVYANGGGGGGGGAISKAPGGDGSRMVAAAPGGTALDSGCGNGGAGGHLFPPEHGKAPSSGGCGGAGGGSAGFILVYTPQSTTPALTPMAVSPGLEPTGVVATN